MLNSDGCKLDVNEKRTVGENTNCTLIINILLGNIGKILIES